VKFLLKLLQETTTATCPLNWNTGQVEL
jgi:hypothetical protein